MIPLILSAVLAAVLAAAPEKAACPVVFTDAAAAAGIHFVHERGATDLKRLPETMGAGVAWLDYDNDGWMDVFLVQSGKIPEGDTGRLYRNNGNGTFTDVTEKAGIATKLYGQGAIAADYDNDGFPDLLVTGFGRNVLYHNNGNGTFTDVTDRAGVRSSGWSTSAAWADVDGDGYLDLFVTRYVDFRLDHDYFCGNAVTGKREYCHPDVFPGTTGTLFHNNGDGTFKDVTQAAGVGTVGKGLGVIFFDSDGDGRPDLYVANDQVINSLFHNVGGGKFEDISIPSGAAVSSEGNPQAGMGVDAGDVDGDGRPDIVVTNFDFELNSLYRNLGDNLYEDAAVSSGFGPPSFNFLAFGVNLFDAANRGMLDTFVANGHLSEFLTRQGVTYAERPFLMWNDGKGHFREQGCGEPFTRPIVARGSAVADYDNDGFPDIAVSVSGGAFELLHNGGGGNAWIGVRLEGTRSNREGVGARLTLETDRGRQVREVRAGSSYLSSSDPRVLFGLGSDAKVRKLEIRWPSGTVQTVESLPLRKYTVIREPAPAPPKGNKP
ncbi:MAG: CRTAC1 family protein [Thermoanaerobaculia bacterium]